MFRNYRLLFLALFLSLFFCWFALSQTGNGLLPDAAENHSLALSSGTEFCAHELVHENLWQKFPDKKTFHTAFEKKLYEFLKKNAAAPAGAEKADFTLPVVVHIIHENGAENINDATVLQGIQHLNDAFENVGYYDQNTGVNTGFAFCLARRDPDGNAASGINRIVSPFTEMVLEDDDIAVKDLSRWDPTQYINIWLVREICSNAAGCGVAGYAYFPASHGSAEDGIMMEASWFGNDPGSSSVIVHEMGHYLGVYHTFQGGCPNNDCLADGDRVCDTPPDNSTAAVPCNGTMNSCSTDTDSGFTTDENDMFWNYMDYGDWDCYSAFTQGQTDRMVFSIENVRQSLLESSACLDPCTSPLTAAFNADMTTLDVGGTVNFVNNSTNYTNSNWTIEGVGFANSANANYTFNQVGFFEICLEIGNADPNCSDKICQQITVTCPVQAEFVTNNFYPAPGQSANYTNQSQNASQYEWQINGVTEGTDTDFSWTFQNEGIYDVCLIASNGLCENEFCLPVFVAEPTGDCENSTFVRIFGEDSEDEEGYSIIKSNDGNLYLSATSGERTLLIKMDISGVPIWQRVFHFSNQMDVISEIIVDADNNIVGCGYGHNGNIASFRAFVFKYDPVNDDVLWTRNFENRSRAWGVLEPQTGGDYLVYLNDDDSDGQDGVFIYLDRNNGNETGNLFNSYDLGSSETFNAVTVVNNELIAAGRYTNGGGTANMRWSVSSFDLNGNENWSNLSFTPLNAVARLYARDIIEDAGGLYSIGGGDDDGTSATQTHLFFQKNSLNGALDWAKRYNIVQFSNEWGEEVVSTPDGFLLYGHERQSPGELFLIKTDKDGNPSWAKSYGGSGHEELWFTGQSQILAIGNFIYFTAETNSYGGDRDIILIKTRSDGSIDDECIVVNELEVIMTPIGNPANSSINLTAQPSQLNHSASLAFPANFAAPYEDLQGCECEQTSDCDTTFLKTYGSNQEDEFGHAMASAPGGGFFLGGGKGIEAMISKLDGEGNLEWTRKFDPTGDASDFIWEIKLDSDNDLIGIGQTRELGGNVEAFAFKYDWQNDNFIWSNEIDIADPALEGYFTILEQSPGGNYNIFGQSGSLLATNALAMEVARNSGANVWTREYGLDGFELFHQTILLNGLYYSTGRYRTFSGPGSQLRPGITCLDQNGNELWTRVYLVPSNTNDSPELIGKDIISDNGLVVFGSGDFASASQNNGLFLYRTDVNGNLEWQKSFDIPMAGEVEATQMLNLPDGYACLGYYQISPNAGSDIFLFKTDKSGNIEWSKSYDGFFANEVDEAYDLLWQNGQIFFSGKTTDGTDEDIFLARLGVDGEPTAQDSCNFFSELTIVETDWAQAFWEAVDMDEMNSNDGFFPDFPVTEDFVLEEEILCFTPCVDSCDLRPDAQLELAEASCGGDSMIVELTICNVGNLELQQGTPIACYLLDPTDQATSVWEIRTTPEKIRRDSCLTFAIMLPSVVSSRVYVIINDDGSLPGPFDLAADFPSTNIAECDYTNNIGSFEINYTPPPLDLGPDLVICENAVTELDAGPGFYRYRWQDGNDQQTYTAFLPGTYSVEVTDSCGGVQMDEITITVDPASMVDLGNDTLICEGDTLSIFLNGFDRFEWFPKNIFACDTCSNVEISPSPNDTIEVIVVASTDLGCYSVDTIAVSTTIPVFTYDTMLFCPGDTVYLFNEPVTETGTYSGVFSRAIGCDSTHTVTLEALANLLLVLPDDITLELGDSIQLNPLTNGQNLIWEWAPPDGLSCTNCEHPYARPFESVIYELVVTDENGCRASDEILLSILKDRGIYIPNAFSPNGDGINDVFHVFAGNNVAQVLEFKVFNRWGGMVFDNANFPPNDPAYGWDGTFRNKIMNPAVFAYKARVEYVDGVVEEFYGDVTLIR